jgi:hypothetical protein
LSYKDLGIYKRLFPLFDGKTYQNTLHIIKIIEIMSNLVYKGFPQKADPRQPTRGDIEVHVVLKTIQNHNRLY